MGRPPCVGMVPPWIGAGLHGYEAVIAVMIREHAAGAAKVRIKRRVMLVALMAIAARGVGLPNLDQRVSDRTRVFVENLP